MMRRKTWYVWTFLALPPVTLAILIAAFMVSRGLSPSDAETEPTVRRALPYLFAVNHLGLFALLALLLRRTGERMRDIGWTIEARALSVAREIGIGILCALGLYLFKELVTDSVRALLAGRPPTFTSLFAFSLSGLDVPLAVAATTLVFVEESIYRGFALPRLTERHGRLWAIAITSVAFGLLHWGNGPVAIAHATAFGVLLAGVYLWRQNLIVVTVAHASYNLAVLLT